MDTAGGELERGRDGHVEILTLNRPEQRNALSPALLEQLSAALADIKRDAGVRAVVLTGAGNRAFCAGMDLKAFAAGEWFGTWPRPLSSPSSPAASTPSRW